MAGALLEVDGVVKRFGGFTALNNVTIHGKQGERFGLIGLNGSGKTTLINCVSGSLRVDQGRIRFAGTDVTTLPPHRRTQLGIARSFQIPKPFRSMTVLENLDPARIRGHARGHDGAAEAADILREIGLVAKAPPAAGRAHADRDAQARAGARDGRAAEALDLRRGHGRASSAEVDDILTILFRLNAQGITIIMIEHIMRAVMRFSERIVVLDAGERIAEGTPEEIVRNPAVEKAYLGE